MQREEILSTRDLEKLKTVRSQYAVLRKDFERMLQALANNILKE